MKFDIQQIRSWLLDERYVIRSVANTAADNITALAEVTGILSIPLLPAVITALSLVFALYSNPKAPWPLWAAITVAVIVVVALESLGITASKTALRLYRAWQDDLSAFRDFVATLTAVIVYALLVFLIILFGEGLPDEIRWVGYTSPFLAVATYVVIGLGIDLQERVEKKEQAITFEQKIENELKIADLVDYKARQEIEREYKLREYEAKLQRKYGSTAKPMLTPAQARTKARQLLMQYPLISGAQLGRELGVSERTGQNILAEITDGGRK